MTDQAQANVVASEDIEHGASGAPPAHYPQVTPQQQQQQQQHTAYGSHAAHLRYGQPRRTLGLGRVRMDWGGLQWTTERGGH